MVESCLINLGVALLNVVYDRRNLEGVAGGLMFVLLLSTLLCNFSLLYNFSSLFLGESNLIVGPLGTLLDILDGGATTLGEIKPLELVLGASDSSVVKTPGSVSKFS